MTSKQTVHKYQRPSQKVLSKRVNNLEMISMIISFLRRIFLAKMANIDFEAKKSISKQLEMLHYHCRENWWV